MSAADNTAFDGTVAYLESATYVMGLKREGNAPDARPHQAGYSLNWFYKHLCTAERLGPVARAYLGMDALPEAGAVRALGPDDPALLERRRPDGGEKPPLTGAQRSAVARALAYPLSFVQGPAGTGKTETILNMVSAMLAQGSTVAVVSNNASALDNIEEKIDAMAARGDLEASEQRLVDGFARLGSQESRKAWSEAHPDEPPFSARRQELWRRDLGCGGWEPRIRAADFLGRHPFIMSTVHSLMKCFADGDAFRYDYLIMDEASQCGIELGVLALTAADHVVLVGDVEQLAPVRDEDVDSQIDRLLASQGIRAPENPAYRLNEESGDGMSILRSAQEVFGAAAAAAEDGPGNAARSGTAPLTFLDKHFRCHPGIIDFCNREIYDGRLEVLTPDFDRGAEVPIRVRWFQGSYCEAQPPVDGREADDAANGGGRRLMRNRRQLEIFLHEEWPRLERRLADEPGLSVCILSPFRGQLIELADMLHAACGHELALREGAFEADGPGNGRDAAASLGSLTIHKSQGQEYDIVYLLPVEDGDWGWPWSQAKRLVNVAVSRAKRELVLIASTELMSERCRRALGDAPELQGFRTNGRKHDAARDERELYIKKLVDYVHERCGNRPVGDFGFHRSRLPSIFDEAVRLGRGNDYINGDSAPEQLMDRALDDMDLAPRGLRAVAHVPLACVARADGRELPLDIRSFARHPQAHLDYVLLDVYSRRIVLAIEVDGALHRSMANKPGIDDSPDRLARRMANDRAKDGVVRALGGHVLHGNRLGPDGVPADAPFCLLRLPTDGSCALETERVAQGADGRRHGFWSIEKIVDAILKNSLLDRAPVLIPAAAQTAPVREGRDDAEAAATQAGRAPRPRPSRRARSLTQLLKKWQDGDPRLKSMSAGEANIRLAKTGLIQRAGSGWEPTDAGKATGIVAARKTLGPKGGESVAYCRYTAASEEAVRSALTEGRDR